MNALLYWSRIGRRVAKDKAAALALFWIAILFVCAFFSELIAPFDPNATDFGAILEGPSGRHWLGTDEFGRDVLSRLIYATRVALKAGALAVGIGVTAGVPIGLFVGYMGGWWDRISMRLVDAVFSLPGLVVAIAVVAVLGPGLTNAMLAIGFLFSLRFIRLTRGVVLSVREEAYVAMAYMSGAPRRRILSRYVLPNIAGTLIVQISLSLAAALLIEAGLSFLGLGVVPPEATWGRMLQEARVRQAAQPFLPFPPGIALTLTVLAFNMIGDRLRDVLAGSDIKARRAPATDAGKQDTGSRQAAETESVTTATQLEPAGGPQGGSDALLQVRNLVVDVPTASGSAPAVRNVSFDVRAGEVVGLVGESGSGKTVSAMAILGLLPDSVSVAPGSSILFDGVQLSGASDATLRQVRGSRVGVVFQDPMTSLNPAMTVGRQLREPLQLHGGLSKKEATERAIELLDRVGVREAHKRLKSYPHEFSGGMAQRVMIAMALAADPDLIIADEPTTALDVTTQRQVLELLISVCEERGMGMLFITHDLGVVAEVCDRAVVLYAGEAVESAPIHELFAHPKHPYTTALLSAVPDLTARGDRLATIDGRVPAPDDVLSGCRFAPRCDRVMDECWSQPVSWVGSQDCASGVRCLLSRTDVLAAESRGRS